MSDHPVHETAPPAEEALPGRALPEDAPGTPLDDEIEGHRTSFFRWLVELLLLVVVSFALAMGIRTYVVQPFYIPTGSMDPTLEVGDRVLVNKFLYRFADPAPGDVVVFQAPADDDVDLIKRVVAVGGQTIDIRDGAVIIDGVEIGEDYLPVDDADTSSLAEPIVVPEGHIFVMGDNRENSSDSRYFGTQPVERVLGRAFVVYWPVASMGGL